MTVLSSHLLIGSTGQHGAGISVQIYSFDGNDHNKRELIAKVITDEQGRFKADLSSVTALTQGVVQFEMVVSIEDLFSSDQPSGLENPLTEIVVRFNIQPGQSIQHIPIIISPNSYSVWWSSPE